MYEKDNFISDSIIFIKDKYIPILNKDIVGDTQAAAEIYNSLLIILLADHMKRNGADKYGITMSLCKGLIWYDEEDEIILGHEWIQIDNYLIDATIQKLIKVPAIIQEEITKTPSHCKVDIVPRIKIMERLNNTFEFKNGGKKTLREYLNSLITKKL